MRVFRVWLPLLVLLLLGVGMAQDEVVEGCTGDDLANQRETLAGFLTADFAADYEQALANLFRLGALYQSMALRCGYEPNIAETTVMLNQTLEWVSLEDLIAAQSVGDDVAEIMLELDDERGDPLNGQLLYNGLEPALGGVTLGCSGCHESEAVAPLTAGTWTRVNDIRLQLPQFTDYTVSRYLVESIVTPSTYLPPDYGALMPEFYGSQLTLEQLADLVAFLESQDQLLD